MINWYIERNEDMNPYVPACGEGIFAKVYNFIDVKLRKTMFYTYKFMFEIMIILSLLYGIFSYSKIADSDLKTGLMGLNVVLIIVCISVIITRVFTVFDMMDEEVLMQMRILKTAEDIKAGIPEGGEFTVNQIDNFDEFVEAHKCDPCKIPPRGRTISGKTW